ncbi:MAG: helix-turn-helix transcriptional regulator [Acidobacteria bacterium]|nr:helix-turn-helix transcriptional regulator [Acidobacteriota bacterium]MCW5969104.1 helix-turn-helix transcriptional regulator [Blastocatellales bacterium]
MRFYRWDKHHHIRMNRHDYFEIFYLQAGELVCRIQDREQRMRSGDLAVINSTQYHTIQLPEKPKTSRQVRAAALYFLPELLHASDASGDNLEYLTPFLMQDAGFPHIIKSSTGIPAQVFDEIKRIHKAMPALSTRTRLTIKTYLKMILILLINHYADCEGTVQTFSRKQRAIEQLAPLFDFLETNYKEPVSVARAAALLHLSESHFMRLFKQVTGQSFVRYLNHFRVAKAERLLATTELSVAEVSQAVGFCDQSYFGLVFRSLVHITPLQYKRQYSAR